MRYEKLVQDFAERTLANLESIEKLQVEQPEGTYYEVTQLINSLLGLLVFPQQRYFNQIPKVPLLELRRQGWPIPENKTQSPEIVDIKRFTRYLRNAITHFNIVFLEDTTTEQIIGIKVWNINEDKEKDWEIEFPLDELRDFTKCFIKYIVDNKLA